MKRYLLNILIWFFDIGLNVLLFAGSPYESISSRVGKQADRGAVWAIRTCKILSAIFGANHCQCARVEDYGENAPNWWKKLL